MTTLGRGGSDTTAVALAAALNADVCEIYSDVDGVYTADPRIVPNAKKLEKLSFEEMLELAAVGSKILVLRSVEYARAFNVPLRVRSSYSNDAGTLIAGSMEDIPMEEAVLTGAATDKSKPRLPSWASQISRVRQLRSSALLLMQRSTLTWCCQTFLLWKTARLTSPSPARVLMVSGDGDFVQDEGRILLGQRSLR